MRSRILIHVQHLLGIGHVRRAAALAHAFVRNGHDVLVATGGMPVPGEEFGGADVLQLPPVRTIDETFSDLVGLDDRPVGEDWKHERSKKLRVAAIDFHPNVLITEHYPFGRRAFRFELQPLIAAVRDRAVVISSVRDILVQKPQGKDRSRWTVETIKSDYDGVLVHSDPKITPLSETFPRATDLAGKLFYTGYIVGDLPVTPDAGAVADEEGEIIVSVGGGAVGERLLDCALDASRSPNLSQFRWRLLVGRAKPPSELNLMQSDAPENVIVEHARSDFRQLLHRSALSISQAGYNTMMDILVTGARALVVPFETESENEQRYRAECFARRGLLNVLPADRLTPDALAAAAVATLEGAANASGDTPRTTPETCGADHSVAYVEQLLRESERGPKP